MTRIELGAREFARHAAACFIICCAVLLLSCSRNDKQQPREPESSGTLRTSESTASQVAVREPNTAEVETMLTLQERIKQQPQDRALRRELGRKAIDASNALVWTIGRAKIATTAVSFNIAQSQAEFAACIDASRWAAYLLAWHQNDYATDFGTIQTQVPGGEVVSKVVTDSTCVVVMKTRLQ